jgi:hypothetical protein
MRRRKDMPAYNAQLEQEIETRIFSDNGKRVLLQWADYWLAIAHTREDDPEGFDHACVADCADRLEIPISHARALLRTFQDFSLLPTAAREV